MPFRTALIAGVLSAVIASGCGGGTSNTTSTPLALVSLGPVVSCLRRTVPHGRVTTASATMDQIARRATKGAAVVRFEVSSIAPKGLNLATIVLERSPSLAEATAAHYRGVYKALGGDPRVLLSRTDNAVIAFGAKPSHSQRAVITRCVRPT
jgi:hypothetical protein